MEKYKVLIIDDEIDSITLLIDFLEDYFEVVSCTDSLKVDAIVEKIQFDAILLDINMPSKDGVQICKELKKRKNYENIPIIFITAFSDIEKIEDSFKVGASDYITKPININELNIRLKAHIKTSKKYLELYDEQIELNKQIEKQTSELLNLKKGIYNKEENFQNREDYFSMNNKKLEENKKEAEIFNQKIIAIQEKLLKQKQLLENAKKMVK